MRRTGCYRGIYSLLGIFAVLFLAFSLFGCAKEKEETEEEQEQVNLSLWTDRTTVALMEQLVEEFKSAHAGEADIKVTISEESELSCKETVLANPKGAADIYTFADDQFEELRRNGALLEITQDAGDVIQDNGGGNNGAVLASQKDGKLFAYPATAGNGYFLYYNSAYLSETDIKSMDRILAVAEKNKKKMMMDYSGGWYIYSFFKAAGLEVNVNEEGTQNTCDWNTKDKKYKGVDVARGMLSIAKRKGFQNGNDEDFVKGVQDGSVIAGINGAWNATKVEKAFGEHYAAAKLPTYTLAGDQVQMCSFAGYKLIGVNAHTKHPEWAMKLARFLTNEENQKKRFDLTGECPSNIKAAASEQVQKSPAIAALAEQAKYASVQRVGDAFWTPTNVFGMVMADGNRDNKDLQGLLDKMVRGITAVPGGE